MIADDCRILELIRGPILEQLCFGGEGQKPPSVCDGTFCVWFSGTKRGTEEEPRILIWNQHDKSKYSFDTQTFTHLVSLDQHANRISLATYVAHSQILDFPRAPPPWVY